jgi:hypothetical protein
VENTQLECWRIDSFYYRKSLKEPEILSSLKIFAKRASEDMGALGECTETLHAKSGHLSKDGRTTSRFSSLFADLGDYDDRNTLGGAQLDKLGYGPYMMTPVLDTG